MPRVLIHFTHGLGDAVQLTSIFQHLAKHRPHWELYLQAQRGKHSVGNGYCRRVWHDQEPSPDHAYFDQVFNLGWYENYNRYADCPNTKVSNCLRDVFRIEPDPALLKYRLHISQEARAVTGRYLEQIGCRRLANGRYNAVVLHYQGNTSTDKKNLPHEYALASCEAIIAAGFVPVLLDWDRRSPFPDDRRIFCPGVGPHDIWGSFGSGDAERLTALIDQASLFVGIDSGPQNGATATPAIGIWVKHHPVQFIDLCDNFLHLVPENHATIPPAQDAGPRSYFNSHYRYRTYSSSKDLVEAISSVLGGPAPPKKPGLVRVSDFWVREDNIEQDLVVIKDVYEGDGYRTKLLGTFADDEVIVDIGAHIGSFAKLWHARNPRARIICVEACPENLECLRANVGDFATVVHAACTYEEGELALLNAVRPNCESTGGSTVVLAEKLDDKSLWQPGYKYWQDRRPLRKVTLEDLMTQLGVDHIDLLKLDCEGSEFSILEKTPSRSKIHFILGEYHHRQRWDELRARIFAGWDYGHMSDCPVTGLGNFHLCNPVWPPPKDNGVQGVRHNQGHKDKVLRLALPSGIGDAYWCLLKVPALLRRECASSADIEVCGGPPYRSREFLQAFDFVRSVEYGELRITEARFTTPEGPFNYAPSQPRWHNRFDWMLQVNGHLEHGQRIEDWLPELEIDWKLMDRFRWSPKALKTAKCIRRQHDDYCVFYTGPERGNTTEGHNRGGLWRPADWVRLAELARAAGLQVLFVGAAWDRSYLEKYLLPAGLKDYLEYLGAWQIDETLAVLRGARLHVGYQSGLGIVATYLGVPAAMFWRPYGDSVLPDHRVTFREEMATAWVPPERLASGQYLPCIYGRCTPESIMARWSGSRWSK